MVRRVEHNLIAISLNNINFDNMPETEKRLIGYHWYEMLEKFYSNPENERKFQKWLKNGKK